MSEFVLEVRIGREFKIVIRYTALIIAITEAGCTGIIYIPGAIVMLITVNNSISRMMQLVANPVQVSWKGLTITPVALKTIKIYRMIQLYLTVSEPIYASEIPVMIFCGSLLAARYSL